MRLREILYSLLFSKWNIVQLFYCFFGCEMINLVASENIYTITLFLLSHQNLFFSFKKHKYISCHITMCLTW